MQLGVLLPHVGHAADPAGIRDVALAAERLGFASVWVGDHIVFPQRQQSHYPYSETPAYPVPADRNFLEAFTTLAFVASVTERVRLGVSVCIVPYRHPLSLVKVVSTLDFLSHGRVILGAGVGWLEEEFVALGVPFKQRSARTDEALEILRGASAADGAFSYHGQFYHVDDVMIRPQPVQKPLPIWVGGTGGKALDRAARFGSAWHPPLWHTSPADVGAKLRIVREKAQAAGRDPAGIAVTMFVAVEVAADDDSRRPWETGLLRGTPRYIAKVLREYEAAGVSHVNLAMGRGSAKRIEAMESIAKEMEARS
jgi:probable F420-dependent oxidoreductase